MNSQQVIVHNPMDALSQHLTLTIMNNMKDIFTNFNTKTLMKLIIILCLNEFKNYLIELHILNLIYDIPIAIYDNYDNLICYFDKGLNYIINLYNKNNINFNSFIVPNHSIKIKYNITVFSFTNITTLLTVIYNL